MAELAVIVVLIALVVLGSLLPPNHDVKFPR